MAVDALIFLSNSSLYKAELANKVLMTVIPSSITGIGSISAPPVETLTDDIIKDSMIYEGSSSGRILLHPNHKKMGGSSRMRISGLMGIPTPSALTPSDAANDLFFLEKKLAELGLMSGVSLNHRNTGTLRSALGESFMLLSTSSLRQSKIRKAQLSTDISDKSLLEVGHLGINEIQSDITPEINIRDKDDIGKKKGINSNGLSKSNNDENNQNSSNTTFFDAPGGAYGGSKKSKVKSQPNTSSLEKQKQNTNSNNFWLPNPLDILSWRGTAGTTTTDHHLEETSAVLDQKNIEENQFDLQWNDDQSMYGGPPVKKSSKDLLTVPTSTANSSFHNSEVVSKGDDNLNIGNDGSNNSEVSDSSGMPESILRLLQCIKRLGDENVSLLQRIDILSTVEAKNMSLHKEMIGFKREYEDRFGKLKEILREFHRRNPSDNLKGIMFDPHSSSTVSSFIASIDHDNEDKKEHKHSEINPVKLESNNLEGQDSTQQKQQEMRQQQLERTVLALVKRLEQSKTDVDKRDRLIGKYEKYYKQLKREAERREIERNAGADPVPENNSISSNGHENRQQSTSTHGQQHQQRAPSMMPARNKHPSISTLETTLGLQRAAGASRYNNTSNHK
eukprot:CAMPEP_0119051580 /NCGR_PEP_ID=MMETSP1177-20130426/73149_1 /TAXON_ID=2985 /ORGANISM="Ochromonas sp, Strain CCMP1899" /LENGTH=618 /DNA_ID=CAMNT_0007030833 /DNA_START=350 /DNA_END=2206 /DNA_ORIENTATION=-